ncbi:MAG: Rne/Rng family ribonuclease [Desulfobulbaceae bacterium]|uniref:Ribonuclease G n=1 Tax=Candidatus Desulfobia pelagia TaxID=2841692 RepID=A0A8J6NDE4_9BACT|nr:Rne/Rng family ribonuclease [Candidatus Desulfobia pelagia]
MATDLVINATSFEIRIALVEHGNLVEFFLERPMEKGLVGNIYKGKVVRVLPGMQAAFVDIGLERTGFLYVDDIHILSDEFEQRFYSCDNKPCCDHNDSTNGFIGRIPGKNIEDLLTEGQDLLVQICKEPIGTKGARLTSHITLPCRNLVFMPMTDHIGISRKIEEDEIRQQLRNEIENLRPAGTGFIVRTVAESATREDLEADMEFLLHLWSEIQDLAAKASCRDLVYEDLDIILRVVRDVFSPDVDRVVVDDRKTYERVLRFLETFVPHLSGKVHHYKDSKPIFDVYGVEVEINRALDKKIWLRCGGYIIIEATEALTVVDVNTGRYVGKNDLEETIFKTNMEAVKEIAYQLRLRNIGGIIIVDFIDMESEEHREEVFRALTEAVKKDKSRINILKVSEFGLVQITRKRSREDLTRIMCEPCCYCNGEGMLKSSPTLCYEIFRKIVRNASGVHGNKVTVKVHPKVADMMLKEEAVTINNLEDEFGKSITIIPCRDLHMERYDITWED